MKNLIAVVALSLCLSNAAFADKSSKSSASRAKIADLSSTSHSLFLGVDADLALPVGNYSDVNGVGGGAMLTAEYPVPALLENLSATARVGFQLHASKTISAFGTPVDTHVNSIPLLVGARYYVMPMAERQGLFAAAELGLFDLMASASSGATSASSSSMKFGLGGGIGYQWNQWNARLNLHTHDVGNFGDALMVTGGIGYQFIGL
jgi:hypothetical protein